MGLAKIRGSSLAGLLAILLVAAVLWDTPFVAPLKLIVVFFHELSHGLAALATGGRIVEMQLAADGSGVCLTRGGSRFVVLNAGYLGSLAWGGLILVLSSRTRRDRLLVALTGALMLAASLLAIRPFGGFGFISCTACGAALLAAARWLTPAACDLVLKVIGLASCLYVVFDLKAIAFGRIGKGSDAHMLADLTGVPAWLWGLVWLAIALVVSFRLLGVASSGSPGEVRPVRRRAAR